MKVQALNPFEKGEFLLDSAASGTLNFSVVGTYDGKLDSALVQRGLSYLQVMHPLLRMSPNSTEKVCHYVQTHAQCPLRESPYEGPDQWKGVVKEELARRFSKLDEPLWRVTLLKGEHQGQLIVTFHHSIADGVCAMELMNHLFKILSALAQGKVPELESFEQELPDLKSLYALSPGAPTEALLSFSRTAHPYHMTFVKESLAARNVVRWTQRQGIRVNATLLAALLLAIRRVVNPHFEEFSARTAVNFRSSFNPPVSKEKLALMRTCLSDQVAVDEETDLATLAKTLHQGLYRQLNAGQHVANLKLLEQRLQRKISNSELWQRSKCPDNGAEVTNLGALEFSGNYGNLTLKELSFFANIVPFVESANNFFLAAVTFRGKISLSLWFIEELVDESVGKAVLAEVKAILSSL